MSKIYVQAEDIPEEEASDDSELEVPADDLLEAAVDERPAEELPVTHVEVLTDSLEEPGKKDNMRNC